MVFYKVVVVIKDGYHFLVIMKELVFQKKSFILAVIITMLALLI